MTRKMNTRLILRTVGVLFAAVCLASGSVHGQTKAELRAAVADCVGLGQVNDEARAALMAWGDAALPMLATMARESGDLADFQVLCAIHEVSTAEAMALLLELTPAIPLLPTNGVDGMALDWAFALVAGGPPQELLEEVHKEPAFKLAVLNRIAIPGSLLMTTYVAIKVVETMGWTEAVPSLRMHLTDSQISVRRAAAQALHTLTGEQIEIEELKPDLITPLGSLRMGSGPQPFEASAPPPGERTAIWLLEHGGSVGSLLLRVGWRPSDFDFGGRHSEVMSFPRGAGGVHYLGRRSFPNEPEQPGLVVLDEQSKRLWEHVVEGRGAQAVAPLFNNAGAVVGLVVGYGADTGVIALDLSGQPMWSQPERKVIRDVLTHPAEPGIVVFVGGGVEVVSRDGVPLDSWPPVAASGSSDDQSSAPTTEAGESDDVPPSAAGLTPGGDFGSVYANYAALLPGRSGPPRLILAGGDAQGHPTIGCRPLFGEMEWTVSLQHSISGLKLLEPAHRSPLIVVSTNDGMLHVLADDGTLVWRGHYADPSPDGKPSRFISGLIAGQLGDSWYFAVMGPGMPLLFRLDG
ncbi:MAG: hypothetical protein ACI9EF_001397 [Pseudohongiellaceae bacterium]